jgi:hypothetical protein
MPLEGEIMAVPVSTPMQDLHAVLAKHKHKIDEADTVHLIAKLRDKGIIGDDEWQKVLQWLDDAMIYLNKGLPRNKSGVLSIDDDPRNADWIQIVRAQRLAGYRMPHWASLWLWWIGCERGEETYWKRVGSIAKALRFPPVKT